MEKAFVPFTWQGVSYTLSSKGKDRRCTSISYHMWYTIKFFFSPLNSFRYSHLNFSPLSPLPSFALHRRCHRSLPQAQWALHFLPPRHHFVFFHPLFTYRERCAIPPTRPVIDAYYQKWYSLNWATSTLLHSVAPTPSHSDAPMPTKTPVQRCHKMDK